MAGRLVEAITLLRELTRRLLRDTITRVAAAAAVLVGLGSLLLPERYQTTVLVFPQVTNAAAGNLASIAAQFGLGNFTGGLSLDFYSQILVSRSVLDSVLLSHYVTLGPKVTLLDDLGYDDGPMAKRLEKGAKKLGKRLAVNSDESSGLLELTTPGSSPQLAVELADSLISIANRSIASALIVQASYQRQYLEKRLADARQELSDREALLERFYAENRTFQQSPSLIFEETRLKREADLSRDLYGNIRQEYDQARLSEARDVPTLSFVGAPVLPYKPEFPKPLLNAALAALASASVVVAIRLLRRSRQPPAPS